jgi:hypothetical protein
VSLRCRLHVARHGNAFMGDLASLVAAALTDAGVPAEVVPDGIPVGGDGVVDLVVAPHEYAAVGPSLRPDDLEAALASSVLVTTEQPGTSWWDEQVDLARAARAVLDINVVGTWAFEAEGVVAHHLQLGYHASLDRWGGTPATPRRYDAAFLGGVTERRLAALSTLAPVLSHRESRLLLHDPAVPVHEPSPWFLTGVDRAELLAGTKVLVNVHRDQRGYFEWLRAVEAFANGAVLLSERSEHHDPVCSPDHFLAVEVEHLADHLTALLADEPLRVSIASAAYELVRSELDLVRLLDRHLPLLEGAACTGPERPRPPVAERGPRALAPAPLPAGDPVQRGLKRVVVGQLALGRRLDRLECRLTGVDPDHVDHAHTPGWASATPEVSVVVPVYGYADTVVAAVESALASDGVAVEVVIVEDHSPDGARRVIERWMALHPDAPVRAAFRAANAGLGAARNLGFELARADRCLPLDADNELYPAALRKLCAALDADPGADFAYAIIEVHGDERSLLSCLPWSPERLAVRNFVDAMALVRKDAWKTVGGYAEATESSIYGWEDYAFWLAMAASGKRGAFVPEPLLRYRRHGGSMIGITNLDEAGAHAALRRRFPNVPWGAP